MAYVSIRDLTRWLVVPMLFVSALALGASPAHAKPSKEEIKQFKTLVANGSKHYQNKEFERALEDFRNAQKIANPPSLRYNVARTLESLGRCREAKDELASFLSIEDLSKAKRRKGRQSLEELEEKCPTRGTLTVACQPGEAEATVSVDGERQACPAEFSLAPGSYTARVTAPGYESQSRQVDVESDDSLAEEITLTKSRTASSSSNASSGGVDPSSATFIAQVSGMAVGAGLLGGGVASDLGANARLRDLRDAERASNSRAVDRLQREANGARTRTIALYAAGSALAVGSAIWMTVDLTTESRPKQGATLRVNLSPRSVAAEIRW